MSPESKKLFNIVILGVAFMFMFTAFQTCGNVAQTVIRSLNSTDFHGSGYTRYCTVCMTLFCMSYVVPYISSGNPAIKCCNWMVAMIGSNLSVSFSGFRASLLGQ